MTSTLIHWSRLKCKTVLNYKAYLCQQNKPFDICKIILFLVTHFTAECKINNRHPHTNSHNFIYLHIIYIIIIAIIIIIVMLILESTDSDLGGYHTQMRANNILL